MSILQAMIAAKLSGSGGGGGSYQTGTYQMGGAGGSGIVVIRVKKFNKIGFSIIVR